MRYQRRQATAKVFNEDIFNILAAIPDDPGDMVYGNPDYNVGIQYADNSYTTEWHDYVAWYTRLAQESMRALAPGGNLFLLNYSRQNDYLRVLYLDDAAHDVAIMSMYEGSIPQGNTDDPEEERRLCYARMTPAADNPTLIRPRRARGRQTTPCTCTSDHAVHVDVRPSRRGTATRSHNSLRSSKPSTKGRNEHTKYRQSLAHTR